MKNLDRFTEPDNYIDQSGRLIKLKWFALIAAVGIALLFFLSGCVIENNPIKPPFIVVRTEHFFFKEIVYYQDMNGHEFSSKFEKGKYQIGDTIK